MDRSSFGNRIVNEDDLAAAGIVGSRKQHTLRIDVADTVGLEVCNNNDLFANELLGGVFCLDGGHDHTLADAVEQGELEAGVGLAYPLRLEDLAYTEVELLEIVDGDLGLDGLDGICLANLFDYLLNAKLTKSDDEDGHAEIVYENGKLAFYNIGYSIKADADDFTGITVGGKKLDSQYYTLKDDLTVTLKDSFLKKLTVGKYKIVFQFTDGEAAGTFSVSDQYDETNPTTGDSIGLVFGVMLTSLVALGGCAIVYRKKFAK